MPSTQITIRLDTELKAQFDTYTTELGVDGSELAKLLIIRERNLGRLQAICNELMPQRRPRGTGTRLPTITAHFSKRADVDEFDRYARQCGLSRSSAGAWLLEAELKERWLESALRQPK